ncbi:hypothetical protein [Chitinophaga sp.]|uniref:hypothetical protein n=1 Tax=Chitinophaga sp. TaxID=1869181 RepID=UPI002DB78F10|nr:hypothetical protein [Chitinophaga sp.]
MKNRVLQLCCGILAAGILFSSCVTTRDPNRLPPGQAKKIYGTKSAKPFAPGQQKKRY